MAFDLLQSTLNRRNVLVAGLGAIPAFSGYRFLTDENHPDPSLAKETKGILGHLDFYVDEGVAIDVPNWVVQTDEPASADLVIAPAHQNRKVDEWLSHSDWVLLTAGDETSDLSSTLADTVDAGWTGRATPPKGQQLTAVGLSSQSGPAHETSLHVTPTESVGGRLMASLVPLVREKTLDSALDDLHIQTETDAPNPQATFVAVTPSERRITTTLHPKLDFRNDLSLVLERRTQVWADPGTVQLLTTETDFESVEGLSISDTLSDPGNSSRGIHPYGYVQEFDRDVIHMFKFGDEARSEPNIPPVGEATLVTYDSMQSTIPVSMTASLQETNRTWHRPNLDASNEIQFDLVIRGVERFVDVPDA